MVAHLCLDESHQHESGICHVVLKAICWCVLSSELGRVAQLLIENEKVEFAVAVHMPIGIVGFVVPHDPQDKKSTNTAFLKVSVHLLRPLYNLCMRNWIAWRTCSVE